MGLLYRPEPFGGQCERRVPADGLPLLAYPAMGLAQAVRIVLDILQGHGLGADVATAEGIVRVALDRADARRSVMIMAHLDVEPADGFAQVQAR